MFQWLGNVASKAIWRRILNEHPGLLEVLLPGNEAALTEARSKIPKLDDAIERFGLPPTELVTDILNGTVREKCTIRKHHMVFTQADACSNEELSNFFSEGYVHIRGAVDQHLVNNALRHINACVGRSAVDKTIPLLTGLPPRESSAAPITELFYNSSSRLTTLVQSLIGVNKVQGPMAGQVALRFPVCAANSALSNADKKPVGGKGWHVDGFGQGDHSPFTLLVGVCLSDTVTPNSGGFAVHPGGHWTLQDQVKAHVAQGLNHFSNFEHDNTKPDLGDPVQMMMKRGDVVLAHQKLPHLGTQNFSPNIRYQVYFRVSHVNHTTLKEQWLDNLMLPFEGVQQSLRSV